MMLVRWFRRKRKAARLPRENEAACNVFGLGENPGDPTEKIG